MSYVGNKTFVINQTFTDVMSMEDGTENHGEEETHFNIPWNIYLTQCPLTVWINVYLTCENFRGEGKWSINATVSGIVVGSSRQEIPAINHVFDRGALITSNPNHTVHVAYIHPTLVSNEQLMIECHVTINKMTGIEISMKNCIFRSFDDESAKKFSDIVLKVKDQKFYVNKMYLASHSSYFESLLFGNFNESKQSEVELKDIFPHYFQKFMEVIHGELTIDDGAVAGILKLADMYDAKTAIRHCETFLIKYSKKTLKEKFQMAIQYKLENLKKKCMSEFNNFEDIASIIPEDSDQFDTKIWKELLNLSITLSRKR